MDNSILFLFGAIALFVIARRFMQSWDWVKNLVFFLGAATLFSSCSIAKKAWEASLPKTEVVIFRDTIKTVKHDTSFVKQIVLKYDTLTIITPGKVVYQDTTICPPSAEGKTIIVTKTKYLPQTERIITKTDTIRIMERVDTKVEVAAEDYGSLWKWLAGIVTAVLGLIAWLRRKKKEGPPAPPPTGSLQYV